MSFMFLKYVNTMFLGECLLSNARITQCLLPKEHQGF